VEDPRLVNRALVAAAAATGAGCVALALWTRDPAPLVTCLLLVLGAAAGGLLVTAIYTVTVWPLVLLLAWAFDERDRPGAGPARGRG
jgi:hypothetical protein